MSSSETTSTSSIECCKCTEVIKTCCFHLNQEPKIKKPNSLSSLAQNLRRGRPFVNKRPRKSTRQSKEIVASPANTSTKSKSPKWVMKFNCTKKERKCTTEEPTSSSNTNKCVGTCYRKTEDNDLSAGVVQTNETMSDTNNEEVATSTVNDDSITSEQKEGLESSSSSSQLVTPATSDVSIVTLEQPDENNVTHEIYGNLVDPNSASIILRSPLIDVAWCRAIDDCDEQARLQRAREIAEGVEPPANFRSIKRVEAPRRFQIVCSPDMTVDSLKALFQNNVTLRSSPLDTITGCHTQVDYIHCLVPDLMKITISPFYWGKMDRYEAERLLDGKPEGTFLLRDSAQEEFLFSVSFRKYERSLHARIEQWNHLFSFDSHDPTVFSSDTVCGLIEHYKDPSSCMFFEPMLTLPLHRNFPFSLQHLCRAVITSRLNYDSINQLKLPKSLKCYLKEYHYRQKVRVERYDEDVAWLDLRNVH